LGDLPGYRQILTSEHGDFLYENKEPLSRAILIHDAIIDETHTTAEIASSARMDSGTSMEWLHDEPGRIQLKIHPKEDSFLFLSYLYFPGWMTTLDGVPVTLYRTGQAFRGLRVPSGPHTVEMMYQPKSFFAGWLITVFSLMMLLFLIFQRKIRSRIFP